MSLPNNIFIVSKFNVKYMDLFQGREKEEDGEGGLLGFDLTKKSGAFSHTHKWTSIFEKGISFW